MDLTPDSPLWKRFVNNIPMQQQYPGFLEVKSHSLESEQKKDIIHAIELLAELSLVVEHFNQDYIENRWTNWHQHDYRDLGRLLKHCIARELLISPSLCKLFVIDGGFLAVEKYDISHALLEQKTCAAMSFLPRSVLCAVAASVEDAVVIHIDWHECSVSILSDLRLLMERTFNEYSLETMHYNSAGEGSGFDSIEALVGAPLRRDNLEELDLEQPLYAILSGLPKKVAMAILAMDIDARPKVATNVIFLGPIGQIPGFKATFVSQLRKTLPTLNVSGRECLGAWTGASLYCLTTLLRQEKSKWKHKEISKDKLYTEAWREFVETCIH